MFSISTFFSFFFKFCFRLLRGNAVEETFAKPTAAPRVRRKSQSQESSGSVAVRSSPRQQNQLSKIAGVREDGKRRGPASSRSSSTSSSSSKVTTVTFDAAARKRKSSSLSSESSSAKGERSGSSSGGQRSRKQKHTEVSTVYSTGMGG